MYRRVSQSGSVSVMLEAMRPSRLRFVFSMILPLLLGFTFNLKTGTVTYTAEDASDSWQGVTPLEKVTLTRTENGLGITGMLEPGNFSSGNFARDANARFTVFNTGEFPIATLEGTLPLAAPLLETQASGTATATFRGTLTLHGVTRDVGFPVKVARDGTEATAEGSFAVLLSDYKMKRPNFFGNEVKDEVELNVSLTGTFAP